MKIWQMVLIGLLALIVVIQFIPGSNNQETVVSAKDINYFVVVPQNVQSILKTSCYDCHSNYTQYPWYAHFQPVRLWLDHHIDEGKSKLNFNEFASYSTRKQANKIREVGKNVEQDEMPLSSYTLIHKDAVLSISQKKLLTEWASKTADSLAQIK